MSNLFILSKKERNKKKNKTIKKHTKVSRQNHEGNRNELIMD